MKKFILLLFISSGGFSQAISKVTAYRVINPHDDGVCSIKALVQTESRKSFLTYITAESDDQKLIEKLLSLKKQAKGWEKSDCGCDGTLRGYQWGFIPNMFVIEKESGNDTIYTNHDNSQIIFPENKAEHHDEKGLLKNALTGKIKEFFEYDFDKQIGLWFTGRRDSIPNEKVLYKGQQMYGMTEDVLTKEFPNAKFIKQDTIGPTNQPKYVRRYRLGKDTLQFSQRGLLEIIIANDTEGWQLDGIAPGIPEASFSSKYPSSARIKQFNQIRYEDLKRMYFCPFRLTGKKGAGELFIKDGIVQQLRFGFSYPEPD